MQEWMTTPVRDAGCAGTQDAALDGFLLDRLEEVVLSSCTVQEFLHRLALLTSEIFSTDTASVRCAIALLRDRKPVCLGFSDQRAHSLNELEYAFGRVPRLADDTVPLQVSDLRSDATWSDYTDLAERLNVRSLVFVPLDLAAEGRAGLTLYSDRPGLLNREVAGRAEAYGRRILKPVRIAARLAAREEHSADLRAAMESRTTIDLAMGIVMGQNRCGQDEAFAILRGACSRRNMKLRDLAALLVASVGENEPRTHFDF